MISGKATTRKAPAAKRWTKRRCSAALLLAVLPLANAQSTASAPAAGAGIGARADAGWILGKLARPAPMRTSFVEERASRLLKKPLRLAGEYRRPDQDTLIRQVRTPYAETTTITTPASPDGGAGQATIERGGKSRTYSLERVPELASLQASFGALLAGDRATLERYYAVATRGTRERWIMALAPKQPSLAAKVKQILLYGRGAELRCIETEAAGSGDIQRTLLATAARAVEAGTSDQALVALCHDKAG